ncbi:SchA/CurD-like domain-containing protein [Streptomyces kronopolitis]|uniref:SchA/CurD-like domain-containing protein n=1 Tax=Streptomyces kronopolitis TaxID=1612435 RepID=UPI003D978E84
MPFAALTYAIRPGREDEVAEVFAGFRRIGSPSAPGTAPPARLLSTAVFLRDATLVRVIEYEGDLDAVARHMAAQPGVQEVERRLKPYLNSPRDTDSIDGFVRAFRQSLLRCVTQIGVPHG